jgi:hypothetical protein
MKGFLWTSGHLGWGIFALAAFTLLWWLLFDLVWRLKNVSIARLLVTMLAGWAIGVLLILLAFYLASH